jgi:hypothetical protein
VRNEVCEGIKFHIIVSRNYIFLIYSLPPFSYPSIGKIKNTNTIEDFKALDKTALFKEITEQVKFK